MYVREFTCEINFSSFKSNYHDKCKMVGAYRIQLGVGRWTHNQYSSWYSSHYDGVSDRAGYHQVPCDTMLSLYLAHTNNNIAILR